MPKAIRTLDKNVVNQIAAGEVVERPAHLLKELIENSLDAGASKIEVHFSEGGRFVQVKDNGSGIQRAEMDLAIMPHSTSKITSGTDLWKINSYGFRGEALASISGVSDFTLISKTKSQDEASCLKSLFGNKPSVQKTSSVHGTTVIVKDLFKNIPARLKFLKSESSETSLIKNTLKAMALPNPKVEFRVLHKNRLLFYWPQTDNMEKRAKEILSLKQPFYTCTKYMNMNVEAVFCAPNEVIQNRKQMWFFVDKRWVDDSTLYSAVMSAYRGLLMHGEYPIVVLNLSCPPEDLDVNIHPSKSKIRFKHSSLIFRAVQNTLRTVLEKAPWLVQKNTHQSRSVKKEEKQLFPNKVFSQIQFQKKDFPSKRSSHGFSIKSLETLKPDIEKPFHATKSGFSKGESVDPKGESVSPAGESVDPKEEFVIPAQVGIQSNNQSGTEISSSNFSTKTVTSKGEAVIPTKGGIPSQYPKYWSLLDILCQANLTYIIAQSNEGLVFIDQHAAHERVLYEKLMLFWKEGSGEIQHRLIPLVLDLEESSVEALFSVNKELSKLGLDIERSGPVSITIQSAPCILKDLALQKALMQLADEIKSQGGSFALEQAISDVCASMACHSAIRAGQAMSAEEMKSLLIQMDEHALSSFCPHGRPVFVEYPFSKMERDFGRRV